MQWREASFFAYYILAGCFVLFYFPIALLIILYSIIVIKLKTQKIPGEQSENDEQRRAKRNRNVLKMAIAIVVGFLLSYVHWSIILLLAFYARDLPCGFWLYYSIAFCMAVSNCAINPCICFILSSSYHQGRKRLLKCFNAAQDRVN